MATLPDFVHLEAALSRVSTERIALRSASMCDGWPLFEATRNPSFNRYVQWPQPKDETAVHRRMSKIIEKRERGEITAVSAVVKRTGEWIALYRFIPFANRSDVMEMGLWTHAKFWNRHFSLELTKLCIDAAFDALPLTELIALAHPDNVPCLHVLEGAGLSVIGTEPRPCEHAPDIQAVVCQITRERWVASRGDTTTYETVPATFEDERAVTLADLNRDRLDARGMTDKLQHALAVPVTAVQPV